MCSSSHLIPTLTFPSQILCLHVCIDNIYTHTHTCMQRRAFRHVCLCLNVCLSVCHFTCCWKMHVIEGVWQLSARTPSALTLWSVSRGELCHFGWYFIPFQGISLCGCAFVQSGKFGSKKSQLQKVLLAILNFLELKTLWKTYMNQ